MSHFLNRQRRSYDRSWLSNHTSRSIIFCYFISIFFHTFVFYIRCRQNYAFFLKPPRKKQKICNSSANYYKINYKLLTITCYSPGGPILHNHGEGFDAPPTLERSGSEHRVGRFPSSSLRFLSPGNGGTERVVKTIEGRFSKRDTTSLFSQYPSQTGEMPPKSFSKLRESNIFSSPHHLKDPKNQQLSFTSSRIWELSFILFFLSLHRVTQI